MLRIERTLQILKSWMESKEHTIESIFIKRGDIKAEQAVLLATSDESRWMDIGATKTLLPWRLSSHDERFFIFFETQVPQMEEDHQYFIEVSTGREGQWDAVNPQFLVYVDGLVVCGLDVNHRGIYLKPEWQNKTIKIALHLYTGMAKGELSINLCHMKRRMWIHNAYYDLLVAKEVIEALPKDSEESAMIYRSLIRACHDLRLDRATSEESKTSILAFSKLLLEEVYEKSSSRQQYTVHAIGHTHIDVAWLWDLRQTQEKVARSYATALDLQSRYPEYKFMASQPVLYELLENSQSGIWKNILAAHEKDMWESEGAMYLEADCNLVSGESLIRQIEWGQKYFKSKFGRETQSLWLPDVFGYSAALPQILKGFGIEIFVTSKISWNETNKLPFDSFRWRGIDGSEIATQFITTMSMASIQKGEFKTIYEGNFNASEVLGSLIRHQQRDIQPHTLMPFGFGDGGGGAHDVMLEHAKRLVKGLPGMPKVKMSHLNDFIKAFKETNKSDLPVWVGELYLEYHRGTYTTNAGIKQRHRQLENQLIRLEKIHTLYSQDIEEDFYAQINAAWQILLLNQFHDILPGTSIQKVYDDAYQQLDDALNAVEIQINSIMSKAVDPDTDSIVLFNPHGQYFSGPMIVDSWSFSNGGTLKIDGVAYPVQRTSTGQVITVLENLSPLALTQGQMLPQVERRICDDESHPLSPFSFQTPFYKVLIDEFGEITSLFDKKHQRELIKEGGKGNRITAFEDRPMRWDAWDISEDYVHYPITFSQKPEIKLLEDGPVALIIEINLTFRQSRFIQHLYFYKTHARIDFKTEVDWHEQQVLLRTEFDLEIHASDARFDIQFGHVKRPLDQNHSYNSAMFEVCAAHWGDLSEDDYGVTLMSDDKFGYNAKGSTLGMSLIKSPTYPNEQSDQGKHNFSYSLLPHSGDAIRGLVHKHAIQMAQVPIQTEGKLRLGSFDQSWLSELPENLIIESLRRINHQEIELRLVEHFNRRGRVQLHLANSFDKIKQVSLKGEWIKTLSSGGREITLEYKPFEIITIRLFTA